MKIKSNLLFIFILPFTKIYVYIVRHKNLSLILCVTHFCRLNIFYKTKKAIGFIKECLELL